MPPRTDAILHAFKCRMRELERGGGATLGVWVDLNSRVNKNLVQFSYLTTSELRSSPGRQRGRRAR